MLKPRKALGVLTQLKVMVCVMVTLMVTITDWCALC